MTSISPTAGAPAAGFLDFAAFADAVALVDESGAPVSYADLSRRCGAFADALGPVRRLVLLEADNSIAAIVAYLGALRAGHVVILGGPGAGAPEGRLMAAFSPDVVWRDGRLDWRDGGRSPALHPDLALLLPTSGSTGSPKLVRLTRAALEANAASIVAYLGITRDDRAITSLPFHYSFGMSVVTSHLAAGARVVVTDRSVTEPEFWALARAEAVTTLAGVPYTYELLERMGLRDDPPPSLRTLTQAGGRLAPDLVRAYARFAEARGLRFFAMYGQTEAAPRMAYLPPELAAENPECVGRAIPGGAFRLVAEDGSTIDAAGAVGELAYRGPNVMMGYAFGDTDLARGAETDELFTGDLARRRANGLYEIVGRASRFLKIAGLRIGLDDVEAMLAGAGLTAHATGDDTRLAICLTGGGDPQAARELVAARCGLPLAAVTVIATAEPPRLASGKVDYAAIRADAARSAERNARKAARAAGGSVAAVYAAALGVDPPPPHATFTSLGGDSLSYVNASIGLERLLGRVPPDWETMTVASLQAMAAGAPVRPAWREVSVEMIIRVLAIASVIVVHAAPTTYLRGGSLVMLFLAGYSLARFQREHLYAGQVGKVLWSSVYRMLLPYYLLLAVLLPAADLPMSAAWPMLYAGWVHEDRGVLAPFWFVETLAHCILITCALFLIPPLRRLARERPAVWIGLWLGLALLAKALVGGTFVTGEAVPHNVDALYYLYVLGWAAFFADTGRKRLLLFAVAAGLALVDYGVQARSIAVILTAGLLLFLPTVRLPAFAASVAMGLAAISFFVYLAHVVAVHAVTYAGLLRDPPWIVAVGTALVLSVGLGWLYARGWAVVTSWVRPWVRGWTARRAVAS